MKESTFTGKWFVWKLESYKDELSRVREETLEDAAKVAEIIAIDMLNKPKGEASLFHETKAQIAAAIRALKK